MKIFIVSDHAGEKLKEEIKKELIEVRKMVVYESALCNNPLDDYPDFVVDVAKRVNPNQDYLVLICSNGIGMSIMANKVKGIRCALVDNAEDVKTAKEHNFINAIAFGSDVLFEDAISFIITLINTPYSLESRHKRRVEKIISYEESNE